MFQGISLQPTTIEVQYYTERMNTYNVHDRWQDAERKGEYVST